MVGLKIPIRRIVQIIVMPPLMLKDIKVPNCKDGILSSDTMLWKDMDNYWNGDNKCMTCIKACSKTIYNTTKHIA